MEKGLYINVCVWVCVCVYVFEYVCVVPGGMSWTPGSGAPGMRVAIRGLEESGVRVEGLGGVGGSSELGEEQG